MIEESNTEHEKKFLYLVGLFVCFYFCLFLQIQIQLNLKQNKFMYFMCYNICSYYPTLERQKKTNQLFLCLSLYVSYSYSL